MSKIVRQSFPTDINDQDQFVLDVLHKRKGVLGYNNLNSRNELLKEFNVRKRDFHSLCIALKRLEDAGQITKSVKTIRETERFESAGYCNPARRRITIALVEVVPKTTPSPYLVS